MDRKSSAGSAEEGGTEAVHERVFYVMAVRLARVWCTGHEPKATSYKPRVKAGYIQVTSFLGIGTPIVLCYANTCMCICTPAVQKLPFSLFERYNVYYSRSSTPERVYLFNPIPFPVQT